MQVFCHFFGLRFLYMSLNVRFQDSGAKSLSPHSSCAVAKPAFRKIHVLFRGVIVDKVGKRILDTKLFKLSL